MLEYLHANDGNKPGKSGGVLKRLHTLVLLSLVMPRVRIRVCNFYYQMIKLVKKNLLQRDPFLL